MTDRDNLNELMAQHIDYWQHDHGAAVDAILTKGWRPPARKISDPAELDALPDGAVVMDQDGDAWQRDRYGNWRFAEDTGCRVTDGERLFNLYQPITVLWPTEVSA